MEERKQFTFYESFFLSARYIRSKAARADFYDAICSYALTGAEPDMEKLAEAAASAFASIKPNLEASRKKAASGKKGGAGKQTESKPEAKPKQPGSKAEFASPGGGSEKEKEKEGEIEKENEIENECYIPPISSPLGEPAEAKGKQIVFSDFWERYPGDVGETECCLAWMQAKGEQGAVLAGLEKWLRSGKALPNGAYFIRSRMWERDPEGGAGE